MAQRLFGALAALLLMAELGNGARRRLFQRFDASFYTRLLLFRAEVGTPPQPRFLILDLTLSDVVIVDYDCQYPSRAMLCPRYCSDESMRRLFCQLLCKSPSKAKECRQRAIFYSENSTSFRDLHLDRNVLFKGYRAFFGRTAADTFQFQVDSFKKAKNSPKKRLAVTMPDEPFVCGLSTEVREMNAFSAMLGLRPAGGSRQPVFIRRLKSLGYVGSAVVSIQRDSPIPYLPSFKRNLETVMFGALDKSACHWTRLPAHRPEEWSFEISDIEFIGEKKKGRSVARISLQSKLTEIPIELADRYVAEGFFRRSADRTGQYLSVDEKNQTLLFLKFQLGGELVTLTSAMLMSNTATKTNLAAGSERRYADEAEWVFGLHSLDFFCFGFDYDVGEVALGRRRRPTDKSAVYKIDSK